jgi:hypothetical protein
VIGCCKKIQSCPILPEKTSPIVVFLHLSCIYSGIGMRNGPPKPFKLAEIAEMAECLRRGLNRPLNQEELEFFTQAEQAIDAEEVVRKIPPKAA